MYFKLLIYSWFGYWFLFLCVFWFFKIYFRFIYFLSNDGDVDEDNEDCLVFVVLGVDFLFVF